MKKEIFIYRSGFGKSLSECSKMKLSEKSLKVFSIMLLAFKVQDLTENPYLEYIRFGDGRYTLILQNYIDGNYKITFIHDKNYANKANRFTN